MKSFMKLFALPIVTALVIVISFSPLAMSQSLGIKGGISYSDQNYNYDEPAAFLNNLDRLKQTGFTAGVFFTYDLWLSPLRFEVNYVQKGSSIEVYRTTEFSPAILGTLRVDDRFDYLSVNLLLTPGFNSNSSLAPYLIAGPRADILLNKVSEFQSDIFDSMRPVIAGATFGLGISLPVAHSTSLLIEGVYNYDFTFAYDKDLLTIKNNSVLLTTGLSF